MQLDERDTLSVGGFDLCRELPLEFVGSFLALSFQLVIKFFKFPNANFLQFTLQLDECGTFGVGGFDLRRELPIEFVDSFLSQSFQFVVKFFEFTDARFLQFALQFVKQTGFVLQCRSFNFLFALEQSLLTFGE